jgi:LysR family nitrogen assimilation transcriptional regulator
MMAETVPPARKTDDARRVDEELILVLQQMLGRNQPITARAAVRNMQLVNHPSTLTRDEWRKAQIEENESKRIKALAAQPASPAENTIRSSGFLRGFKYFVAVARAGNFGQAARELRISQPALTKQVRAMEQGLGTPLLIRHSRGVTLTRAGSRLLEVLDSVTNLAEASIDNRSTSTADIPTLRLAVPAEVAALVVPPVVDSLRERWPRIVLNTIEGTSVNAEEALLNYRADLALLQDPPSLDDMKTVILLEEKLGLVSSPMAAADRQGPMRFRDLAHLRLILPSRRSHIRRRVDRACFQHKVRLIPIFEVDSVQLTKALVRRWHASTILPLAAAQDEVSRGFLTFSPIEAPSLIYIHAVAVREGSLTPIINEAANILCGAVSALVGQGAWPGARVITTEAAGVGE